MSSRARWILVASLAGIVVVVLATRNPDRGEGARAIERPNAGKLAVGESPRLDPIVDRASRSEPAQTGGEGAPPLELSGLSGNGTIVGTVADTNGVQVAGAHVVAYAPGTTDNGGRKELAAESRSDELGRFVLELDGPGPNYAVHAECPAGNTEPVRVALAIGETVECHLRLPGGYSVTGIVVQPDLDSSRTGQVHVWARESLGDGKARQRPFLTTVAVDAGGRFQIELPHAGEFRILATDPLWCASEPRDVALSDTVRTEDTLLSLGEPTAIAGRVVWDSGQPAPSVLVAAMLDDRDAEQLETAGLSGAFLEQYYFGADGFVTAQTDEDGAFRLAPIRPGGAAHKLLVCPDASKRHNLVVERGVAPGAEAVQVVLTPERVTGGFVDVRLRGANSAAPVLQHHAQLYQRNGQGHWSLARSVDGPGAELRVEGLEPGTSFAMCILTQGGYMPVFVDPWVAELDGLQLDLEVHEPRFIAVSTSDAGPGQAVVQRVVEHPAPGATTRLQAGADGRARIPVAPGRYFVHWVFADGHESARAEVEVERADIDVVLDAPRVR